MSKKKPSAKHAAHPKAQRKVVGDELKDVDLEQVAGGLSTVGGTTQYTTSQVDPLMSGIKPIAETVADAADAIRTLTRQLEDAESSSSPTKGDTATKG